MNKILIKKYSDEKERLFLCKKKRTIDAKERKSKAEWWWLSYVYVVVLLYSYLSPDLKITKIVFLYSYNTHMSFDCCVFHAFLSHCVVPWLNSHCVSFFGRNSFNWTKKNFKIFATACTDNFLFIHCRNTFLPGFYSKLFNFIYFIFLKMKNCHRNYFSFFLSLTSSLTWRFKFHFRELSHRHLNNPNDDDVFWSLKM